MNEREAQELLDFLVQRGVTDLELDQTGGNVYAVIRKDAGGVSNFVWQDENIGIHFVWQDENIGIHFYQGTTWEDGDEPSNFAEVHVS